MAKWELIIPVIVAIIAAIGSAFPVFVSNPNIHEKPDVYASVQQSQLDYTALVRIGNSGSAPATNMTISLFSPQTISNVTAVSATDVYLKENLEQINNHEPKNVSAHRLDLLVPKLLQGKGSVIQLRLLMEKPAEIIRVQVLYDQGSVESGGGYTPSDHLAQFYEDWIGYYSYLILLVFVALIGFFIYYSKKRKRAKFISLLVDELLDARTKLMDIANSDLLSVKWLGHKNVRKIISDVRHFVMLDDLYKKLIQRNDNLKTDKIRGLNQECFFLINKVLDIEWEKYR